MFSNVTSNDLRESARSARENFREELARALEMAADECDREATSTAPEVVDVSS